MARWMPAPVYLIAFCGGVIGHRFFDELIPLWLIGLILVVLAVASLRFSRTRIILACGLGLAWPNIIALDLIGKSIDSNLEKKDVIVVGRVLGVPVQTERYTRFDFKVDKLQWQGEAYPSPGKVRLKIYHDLNSIAANQSWHLTVRLKNARGQQNPGARFNYETWLFQNRIRATGYVRDENNNRLISDHVNRYSISRFREQVALFIEHNLNGYPGRGVLTALVVGVRGTMSEDQWKTLQSTGTIHLVAISGLHIGLIAGMVMWLVGYTWRMTGQLQTRIPAINIAMLFGFVAGLSYAVLAGMTIPTRRAVIMLAVVGLSVLIRRNSSSLEILLLALGFVLLIDPLTPLATGFWLSFGAVVIIVCTIKQVGLTEKANSKIGIMRKSKTWVTIQLALSLGLLPLLLVTFHQVSLVSPIANFIAIPVIGFFTVPLGLVGLIFYGAGFPELALWLFKCALVGIDWVWDILQFLGDSPWSVWYAPTVPYWVLLSAAVGISMVFLRSAIPGKLMAVVWFLPLMMYHNEKPDHGQFRYIMHDVGQGLSSVIETRSHTLVYDTGPHFPGGLDSGKIVMLPYLRSRGIGEIDTLVVSHEHNDHSGGYASIRDSMVVNRVLSGTPEYFQDDIVEKCTNDQSWLWDGVKFEILWPTGHIGPHFGNDASCVIRVSSKYGSILLTGDIERGVEYKLSSVYGERLKSDILQVPHQGSKTSSTATFIKHVQPDYALISSGYLNRFGHPHREVVGRYQNYKIRSLNTAHSGAIVIDFKDHIKIESSKDKMTGYWYNR